MNGLLKFASIIMMVFAIIGVIIYALLTFTGIIIPFMMAAGIIGLICSIFLLVAAGCGLNAPKSGRYGRCVVLGIIILICAVIAFIIGLVAEGFQWISLVDIILPILYLIPVIKLCR